MVQAFSVFAFSDYRATSQLMDGHPFFALGGPLFLCNVSTNGRFFFGFSDFHAT